MIFRYIVCILISFITLLVQAQNDRDYIRRGNRLTRDSLFSKAQVEFQKAIEFDNTNPQAHYNLGNALLFQNKPEDAIKEYETAIRLERNKERKAMMYHNMGVVFQGSKQVDKALECYKHSLRNNPNSDETRYNYALCLYQLKNGNQNQDQQQDQNGEDEKQEEQQEQEKQKQQKENEQKQQENPLQMSRENAEQMLNAAMQDEKDTQEKIQKAMQHPRQKHLQKQW